MNCYQWTMLSQYGRRICDSIWMRLQSRYNEDGLCKGKNEWTVFKSLPKDVTDENAKQQDYDGMAMCVVGMGGKDFLKMSKAEITASMKTLWNSGYFVIFCVRYKGDDDTSGNGRISRKRNAHQ